MSRLLPRILAVLLAVLALPGTAAPASDLPPGGLQIAGGDDWHAERELHFDWQPLPPPGQPFQSVYRLYDAEGKAVRGEARPLKKMLYPIPIASPPGVYTLETWLENEAGEHGQHSTATFRFDDAIPPAPTLQPPPGWVLEGEPALLGVGPGPEAPPLSGIRGFMISVNDEEADLAGAGSISLGVLPEGVYSVRAVAVSGSGVASPAKATEVRVDGTPPLLSLQGMPNGWSDNPVQLTVLARDELSGMAATGPLGPSTSIAVDGAAAAWVPGDRASAIVTGSGTHRVEYFARDAAGNVSGGGAGAPVPASTSVRIDEDQPKVAFAATQDPADPERIEASVEDALSGPSPVRGWIEVRQTGTGSRFEQLPTRVAGDRLIARWDSDSYPQGRYEFRAIGFDLAGNAATGTNRSPGGRMVLPSPLKLPVSLEAGFAGKRTGATSARRVRFGRGVQYGGRLRTVAGAPVAGVEVAVTESFGDGSELQRRTTLARTGVDGRFQVRLAPGPNRQVAAVFAGNRTLTRAASKEAHLEVPASVRLRASAATARVGGAPVVFSGRVIRKGAAAAAVTGLPVELQFRFRGGRWSGFRTVETDARGRFRYPYRFSDDDSRGVRFQFRAYVKGREGWPFGPSASRPVLVTGR